MKSPSNYSNRVFGIFFSILFFIVFIYLVYFKNFFSTSILILSISILFLGIINSKLLSPFKKMWIKFGLILNSIFSPLLFSIIYFFLVFPTSLILKIIGKDILKLKKDMTLKTYWIDRKNENSDMRNQF